MEPLAIYNRHAVIYRKPIDTAAESLWRTKRERDLLLLADSAAYVRTATVAVNVTITFTVTVLHLCYSASSSLS